MFWERGPGNEVERMAFSVPWVLKNCSVAFNVLAVDNLGLKFFS